ncbi:SpoIIE family protein phosphatase [Pumilibacter intestinalis]|uniref:SpoIIE family protein phosphatase n=1 Tax=Pumilibacter intestinalis TaxID=2941511 RepID=UPI0020418613|nr:SpoIIE family protein phosphatase [Pumilibacter intestinalis]
MIKRAIIKYIFVILSLAALCGAEFSGLRPCGAGFAAALVYCGIPAVAVLPAFGAFTLAFDFTLASLAYALSVCGGIFVAALFSLRKKKAKKPIFAAVFALSQFSLVAQSGKLGYLGALAWGLMALGLFAAAVCFLVPVLVRRMRYKFLETELVCGGILLICASAGLSRMSAGGFDAAYLIAPFFVCFAAGAGSLSGAVAVAMCFGSGIAITSATAAPIAFMAFSALVAAVFAAAPRPLPSLSAAAGYVLASYMFSAPPSWQQTLCFAAGALAFALVSPDALAKVRDMLFSPATAVAARGVIGRAANETGNDLLSASRIFDDMKIAMEQVPETVEPSVLERRVCADCDRYRECAAGSGFKDALAKMERSSAAKGRASVSEVPALLSACKNLPALVSCATEAAQSRHEQMIVSEARKEGRKIVAQQLGLMSNVLKSMGERVKTPAHFDTASEKKIAVELSYRGAAVPEVIVTADTVSVVLQSDSLRREDVAAVIGKIMKTPYKFVRGGADVLPGYTLMLFTRAPRYDVAFSVAASAKEGVSGDNHSFVHLGGDRFMMALCDGMGSGEAAEKASETAIELVESFFKAGLDSMSAVECVNRFLALNECERFSTLDITVIDLNSGNAEIIKLSSPATVIKSRDGVSAVSGASLPMGVFEKVNCGHVSRKLAAGDEIVMATDGITDALGSTERFVAAVSAQKTADPHVEAQNLLECAVASSRGRLRDDATVLCARIFEKIG